MAQRNLGLLRIALRETKPFNLESSEEGLVAHRRIPKHLVVGNEFKIGIEIVEVRKSSIPVRGWLMNLVLPEKIVELLRWLGDEEAEERCASLNVGYPFAVVGVAGLVEQGLDVLADLDNGIVGRCAGVAGLPWALEFNDDRRIERVRTRNTIGRLKIAKSGSPASP